MNARILLVVSAILIGACQPAPRGTAISNVTVIDAVNGIRENRTVVFDGDEIIAIEPAGTDLPVVDTIDGSGKFLIPGLWDFHVHLTYDDNFTDSMPATFLSYGITSVRDTGGLLHKVLPVVAKLRAPGALAPRVFFAGPLLDGNFVVYDGKSRPEIGVRNATPDDARAMVRSLKEQGVDFIKVYELVSPDVFQALVETANELDLPIDSHVPLSLRASTAGPSVDSIEHLRNIEMDCASNAPELHETRLDRLKNPQGLSGFELRSSLHALQRLPAIANYDEKRCDQTIQSLLATMQVPTLRLNAFSMVPPYRRSDWQEALSRLPARAAEPWQAQTDERLRAVEEETDTTFADWSLFLTGRMHAAGVPIGAGTDTPIGLSVPGFSLHSELELLVRAGLSPLEAIRSATQRPAEFFSLQDSMGSIDVGKKADMVLLDANPLDDIANTKKIVSVITKGRLLTRDALDGLIRDAKAADGGQVPK